MKIKTSKKKDILIIAAMSGGEIRKDICKQICDCSKNYYDTLMARMKNAGEAETKFGTDTRTLYIKKQGVDVIKNDVPWILDAYDNDKLKFRTDTTQRKADVSQILYNMQLSDIPFYPNEKQPLYEKAESESISTFNESAIGFYCPMELKTEYTDELKGSRLCGLLRLPEIQYVIYNMDNRNIVFYNKIELRASTILEKCGDFRTKSRSIIYGTGYEPLLMIMGNMSKKCEYKTRGIIRSYSKITPDMQMYYILNGEDGVIYLQSLLQLDAINHLKEDMRKKTGKEVMSFIPMYLPTCARIQTEQKSVAILCLEDQKEIIQELAGNLKNKEFITLEKGQLKKYLKNKGSALPWNLPLIGTHKDEYPKSYVHIKCNEYKKNLMINAISDYGYCFFGDADTDTIDCCHDCQQCLMENIKWELL